MARLQRRNPGQSKIRGPIVVGPPVITAAPKVRLADPQRPGLAATRRAPHSKLRAPVVVGPSVITPRPRVKLVVVPPKFFRTRVIRGKPDLTQPLVYIPAAAYAKLVRQPRAAQHVVYKFRAPVVVNPGLTYPQPLTRLSPSHRLTRKAKYSRWNPSAVGPPTITPKPALRLVTQARRYQKFLSKVGAAILPPPIVAYTPPRTPTFLVAQTRAERPAAHRLGRPIVGPGLLYPRAAQRLVQRPKGAGGSIFWLTPPTVVDPFVPPPPPVVPPASWSPFIDGPQQKDSYTAPELWYGDKPPPRRRR